MRMCSENWNKNEITWSSLLFPECRPHQSPRILLNPMSSMVDCPTKWMKCGQVKTLWSSNPNLSVNSDFILTPFTL
jgi:hypothetical protein